MDIDNDVELIVPDNLDESDVDGIFPDFSQVQIQVHGSDVAEKILENHTGDFEVVCTEEYRSPAIDNDIQEIFDDYPEQLDESVKIIENILPEQENIQEYTGVDETLFPICPDTGAAPGWMGPTRNVEEDVDKTESVHYQEEDLDNIERIPDKDISKYDAVIEEYPQYANVEIKEEIEPFTGTDYTDFEAGPAEQHNIDDLPPEDIYHWKNVIILGSKPCQSTSNGILKRLLCEQEPEDDYEIKKENLNAEVILEDWGAKLEKSQCFCKECGTLFVTPNDLDAHKMIVHSFLVPVYKNVAVKSTTKSALARKSTGAIVVKNNKNIARKSTGSKASGSKFCNHCNNLFPDNTTLIKHLYELLPLKQFTCNVCNAVFNTQKELTDHNVVHIKSEKVTVKKEKIVKKGIDIKKKLLYEEEVKKHSDSPKRNLDLIPQSVLFQCPKCGIHFVTANAGFLHNRYCDSSPVRRKPPVCDTCKRKIHAKDLDIHKKQHKTCTKFRVFKVGRNLSDKILCKCPNCKLHFSDFGMYMHLKQCGKIPSVHCQKCNILVPKTKIVFHMKLHTQQNLKPKDFLIIQYCIQESAVKRKLEPPMLPRKKIKLEHTNPKVNIKTGPMDDIKEDPEQKARKGASVRKKHKYQMFFCTNCKVCSSWSNHRNMHLKKQCLLSTSAVPKVICPECGLQFNKTTIKYHKTLHKKELSIHDIAFIDLHTLKRTVPSVPDYPQCPDCKINFFEAKVHANHICGEDYETCIDCGEKYHSSSYGAHVEFHKLIDTEQSEPKMATKLIPELMKKYKSLNMMWNILYSCKNCDMITDQYDKAVEHSQGHLNNEPMTKNIKCYICNLKFDETCWCKHSELHSRMNINSKDFKILSYDPRKLLTEEWYDLFQTLPKEQIRQVTDKSVYCHERRFKMKLLKEGRSEFTIYCCSDCNVGCRNNEIQKHVNTACRNSTNICKICSIPFSDISTLRNHQIVHLNGVKKEEFRVVTFTKRHISKAMQRATNKPTKAPIKHKQPKQESRHITKPKLLTKRNKNVMKGDKLKRKSYKGIQIHSNGKYILYRCKNCNKCIHLERNIHSHYCRTISDADKCQYCNEYVHKRYLKQHETRHIEKPDFNVNNFIIKLFDPRNTTGNDNELEPAKKKPKTIKSKATKGSRTKINRARKQTSASKIMNDYYEDVDYKTTARNKANVSKPAVIYKCNCGLHYTSLNTIEKHTLTCDSDTDISKEHCSKCGLLFPTDVLVSHLCKHHSKNSKFTIELYEKAPAVNVEDVESTSESPVPKKTRFNHQVKLYKCGECNVYFVNQNTCYKHVVYHRPVDQRQCIECKLCGLPFSIKILALHVKRHHNNELSLDNILIEEYHPPKGKERTKMNLYVASDRVQSLQVTSSIEDK